MAACSEAELSEAATGAEVGAEVVAEAACTMIGFGDCAFTAKSDNAAKIEMKKAALVRVFICQPFQP